MHRFWPLFEIECSCIVKKESFAWPFCALIESWAVERERKVENPPLWWYHGAIGPPPFVRSFEGSAAKSEVEQVDHHQSIDGFFLSLPSLVVWHVYGKIDRISFGGFVGQPFNGRWLNICFARCKVFMSWNCELPSAVQVFCPSPITIKDSLYVPRMGLSQQGSSERKDEKGAMMSQIVLTSLRQFSSRGQATKTSLICQLSLSFFNFESKEGLSTSLLDHEMQKQRNKKREAWH